jgi:hypothetical protein
VFTSPVDIDEAISDFATRVTEAMQQNWYQDTDKHHTLLENLSFGASAAENEFRERVASEKFSQRIGQNITQLESDSELESTSSVKTA